MIILQQDPEEDELPEVDVAIVTKTANGNNSSLIPAYNIQHGIGYNKNVWHCARYDRILLWLQCMPTGIKVNDIVTNM